MFKIDRNPIVVEVIKDRWNAFSLNPTPTPRDFRLIAILHGMGGVSDTVPYGTYHFNMKRRFFTYTLTLTPQT
jgi:hypothetical protein